jgi:hypothetical protein
MSYILMALSSSAGFQVLILLAGFVLACNLGFLCREIIRSRPPRF